MMFPQLAQFTDVALLLLRVMVGIVFITSGWKHLKDPEARSKDIGMSKGFTIFLGAIEVAASLGVILGVLTQLAAAGLILIMLCAIQKKIFVWRTGFWGESGTNGWSYDTMLVVMNLVIVTTGGGNLSLMKWAATGKPRIIAVTNTFITQAGASKLGKRMEGAWINSQATIAYATATL
jgi:putative oxidoreductase